MVRVARLVALLGLVALFVGPNAAAAGQQRISPVQAIETVCFIPDQGVQWVTGDGILHVRGQVRRDRVEPVAGHPEPRVNGWAILTADLDMHLATGDGTLAGSLLVVPNDESLNGFFQGRFTAKLTGSGAAAVPQLIGRLPMTSVTPPQKAMAG